MELVVDAFPTRLTVKVFIVVSVGVIVRWRGVGLIDTVVIVDIQRMDNARHGHVFLLHCGIDGVLSDFLSHQTVHLLLRLHFDACGVCLLFGFVSARLVAHNLSVVRAPFRCIDDGGVFLTSLGRFFLSCLLESFLLFPFFGRGLCKLSGLDFLVRHLHLTIETDIIAMRQEEVLRVVAVEVMAQHSRYLLLRVLGGLQFRMGHVVVVSDTAVLTRLTMVERTQEVQVIAVAHIRSVE